METTKFTAIYSRSGAPYVGQHAYATLAGLHQALGSVHGTEPHDVFTGSIKEMENGRLDWGSFSVLARHTIGKTDEAKSKSFVGATGNENLEDLFEDEDEDEYEDSDEGEDEEEEDDDEEEVSLEREQFVRHRGTRYVRLVDLSQVITIRHSNGRPDVPKQVQFSMSNGDTVDIPIDCDFLLEILDAWMVCRT